MLNFADYCLQTEGGNFRRDVEQEFLKFAKRKVATSAISSKMRPVLVKQHSVKWAELADSETKCLDLQKLPSGVVDKMHRQRKVWYLRELPQADESQRAAPQGEGTELEAEITSVSVFNIR